MTIRITRPCAYPTDSIGHSDVSARQGHYFTCDLQDAVARMAASYPKDTVFSLQVKILDTSAWHDIRPMLIDRNGRDIALTPNQMTLARIQSL